jgi:hypothetical protein
MDAGHTDPACSWQLMWVRHECLDMYFRACELRGMCIGPMVYIYPLWNIGVANVIELGCGFITQQAFARVHR